VLTGPPEAVVGLLARRIDARQAEARGLAITGDRRLLRRLRPATRPSATKDAVSRSAMPG
jgi:hypothetical protein